MAKCKSIICWGETFRSLRALAKDPRCQVGRDGLIYRLQVVGLPPEEAVTNRSLLDMSHETSNTKFCWHCGKLKPLPAFHKSPTLRKSVMSLCKPCNSLSHRRWVLKTSYPGFSLEQFEALFKKQKGRCACCRRKLTLVVDHCHKTGQVRSLLCNACNTSLGLLKESIRRSKQLTNYIKNFC